MKQFYLLFLPIFFACKTDAQIAKKYFTATFAETGAQISHIKSSDAQIKKSYFGMTLFHTDFLFFNQHNSKLLPINERRRNSRSAINHQVYYQFHVLLMKRLELNIGTGINWHLYSTKGEIALDSVGRILNIGRDVKTSEREYELNKIKRNNLYWTVPIGAKFFILKDEMEQTQTALSVIFLTERNLGRKVGTKYKTIDGGFVSPLSGSSKSSSFNPEIEDFFENTVTKTLFSLRIGFSIQYRGEEDDVRFSSFDIHYVHYFNSFESDIVSKPRGISVSWKYQF